MKIFILKPASFGSLCTLKNSLPLVVISFFSYQKQMSASGFILGNRSMNSWLTALAAHASDMSSSAAVFTKGIIGAWTAIGLIICMYQLAHHRS